MPKNIKLQLIRLLGLSAMVLVLTFATQSLFNFETPPNNSRYFSDDSLTVLKNLNQRFDMVIADELSGSSEGSLLMADVLGAGVSRPKVAESHRGLIVSIKDEISPDVEGILLLEPREKLSDGDLQKIAETYASSIPEFSHVELDQELVLSASSVEKVLPQTSSLESLSEKTSSPEIVKSIRIAIIDSGLDVKHSRFKNGSLEIDPHANVIDDNDLLSDDVGHGTHIAGIITLKARHATLLPYKIVDEQGGRLSNVIEAINLSIEANPDIINMSFGVLDDSYALRQSIESAFSKGIIVVAAAGNFNSTTPFYPATYDETIAVAGVYPNGTKIQNSNFGEWIDIAARGNHVFSSLPNNKYGFKSGTSQATALLTGNIGNLLLEQPDLTKDELLDYFKNSLPSLGQGPLEGIPFSLN